MALDILYIKLISNQFKSQICVNLSGSHLYYTVVFEFSHFLFITDCHKIAQKRNKDQLLPPPNFNLYSLP